MANLTLLQTLQAAARRMGFAAKSQYVGSYDEGDLQLLENANAAVAQLLTHPFPVLKRDWTLTLTTDTEYEFPSDFGYLSPDTMFNETRSVDFPTSDSEWLWLEAGNYAQGYRYKARIANGKLEVYSPTAGDVIKVQYIVGKPITSGSDGNFARWQTDADTHIFDDELLTCEVIWRFKRQKGMDWAPDYELCKQRRRHILGTAGGARMLSMGGDRSEPPYPPHTELWVD